VVAAEVEVVAVAAEVEAPVSSVVEVEAVVVEEVAVVSVVEDGSVEAPEFDPPLASVEPPPPLQARARARAARAARDIRRS